MNKSLKTLGRIKKFQIDEQRKLLMEKLTKEEEIIKNIQLLDKKFAEEKEFATNNPGVGDFGAYTKRYLKIRQEQEDYLQKVRQEIETIRDKISDMFKEQKTFEIVDENRKKHERFEQEQKDQKMLDEIGTNAYIKNHEATS